MFSFYDQQISRPRASGFVASLVPLYVGNLDSTVTESMLFNIFSQKDIPPDMIHLHHDPQTHTSFGYASVYFLNPDHCKKALEMLKIAPINGKRCRVMPYERDSTFRSSGYGNLFIKNLDPDFTEIELEKTFGKVGEIYSSKLERDEYGRSKCFAFVHYRKYDDALKAIRVFNGKRLSHGGRGKVIYVGHYESKEERRRKREVPKDQFTNIYVKNLKPELTQKEFENIFAKCGTITSAFIQKDADGKSRRFGFVNFENHDEALDAIETFHDTEYDGETLYVARAEKKAERREMLKKFHQLRNIYVGHLDDTVDKERLRKAFEPFGTIESAKVIRHPDGHSKGYGFVYYSNPEEAKRAMEVMDGKVLESKQLRVCTANRPRGARKQPTSHSSSQRKAK